VTFFRAYLSQSGAHLETTIEKAEADRLYAALAAGQDVQVWVSQRDATGAPTQRTGIFLAPRTGGVVVNLQPARPIPLGPDGRPTQGPPAGWLAVEQMPRGRVLVSAWNGARVEDDHEGPTDE